MSVKLIFIVGLAVISISAVLGAPTPIQSDKELRKNIVEFLKQDREFLTELEKASSPGDNGDVLLRHRRQSELDDSNQNVDDVDTEQKEGFFNRAAKFIVDLLQRFLKWINTDTN